MTAKSPSPSPRMWKPWPWHRRHSRDHAGDAEPRRRRSHRSSSTRSSTASVMEPWLLALPDEATESVLQFLDHKSLHALELSGRSGLKAIQSVEFWHRSLSHSLVCYDDPLASPAQRAALWKRMHCLRSHRKSSSSSPVGFASDTLLTGVVANDSPNDFSVPPTWLLFKSRCWFWMEKLLSKTAADLAVDDASMYVRQLHCGCGYHVPCFWSSGSSTSEDASSFLEFNVRAQTFVAGVQLVPYQAYWLDENPAFAPKRVSFSFFHRDSTSSVSDASPVSFYTSPVFPVKNTMTLQHFELPKTVYAASDCVLRVNLIGRTQRAPLDERPWIANNSLVSKASNASEGLTNAPFYCCLSYINASGIVIPEETLKKPKKWWLPIAHQ